MYRLRCFGTMALEGEEGDHLELRSRKHSALLLYLLAHRGRRFPRERLAGLFWDTEPSLARHSLSQALYDIRKTLPGVDFDTSTGQVGAGAESVRYDGEAFEEAVRTNDLKRAVRIYGGRFAPDVEDVGGDDFVRWVESERQRYRRLAETALYRHVRACDDQAEWGEMCVSALRLIEMNPLSQDAHRAFMRGLWLQGDQAAAIRHFEEVESFLEEELPGGVSQETRDLVERIRSSRPTAADADGLPHGPPEMVGRKEEFEALKRALENLCEEGRSGLVRIHGEAGVGKTRLLEEFRGLAALDGARVLESRCYAAESDVPYGPVVEGLGKLADEAAGGTGDERAYHQLGHLFPDAFDRPVASEEAFVEPDAGRRRLYEESADLVRKATDAGPIVWLVEDAHWMDASSAALIHYVARRLADHPLLLVLTARTHENAAGPTRDLLEDESDSLPDAVDLELGWLERDEMKRLVASVLDEEPEDETVARIHELAGGNPFYALELLRSSAPDGEPFAAALEDDEDSVKRITGSLKALLRRRLRGLDRDSHRVMETVAVGGRHVDPGVIREATDFSADELAERGRPLYARGLLRDTEDGPEFAHDITREFVYGNMGDLQRSALHLSIGEILEDSEEEIDQATLARHFAKGGDRARAYQYALGAAKEAERRHAHDEAIQMAEMALDKAVTTVEDPAVLWVLAKAEFSRSNLRPAHHYLTRLTRIPASCGHDPTAANLFLARVSLELNQWQEATKLLRRAETRIRRSKSTKELEHRLECLHFQMKTALKADEPDKAVSIRQELQSLVQSTNTTDLSPKSYALIKVSFAAYHLHCESSKEALNHLRRIGKLSELPSYLTMTVLFLRGAAETALSLWDHSRATLVRGYEIAKQHNDIIHQLHALNNLMCVAMDKGEFDDATKIYEQLSELGASTPEGSAPTFAPEMNYADVLLNQGRYRRAIDEYRALAKQIDGSDSADTWDGRIIESGLGLSLLARGSLEEAEAIYRSMGDRRVPDSSLGSLSSSETVVWFQGFMKWRTDPEGAKEFMEESGEHLSTRHREQGRRVSWLCCLFLHRLGGKTLEVERPELYSAQPAKRLREVGNMWYVRSSTRWLESVISHMP